MGYEALFEDEESVFSGSPKSKFMDVVFTANNDVVRYDLEQIVQKMAAMELMLEKYVGEDVDSAVKQFAFENGAECDMKTKSLFVEFTGSIVSKSE